MAIVKKETFETIFILMIIFIATYAMDFFGFIKSLLGVI